MNTSQEELRIMFKAPLPSDNAWVAEEAIHAFPAQVFAKTIPWKQLAKMLGDQLATGFQQHKIEQLLTEDNLLLTAMTKHMILKMMEKAGKATGTIQS